MKWLILLLAFTGCASQQRRAEFDSLCSQWVNSLTDPEDRAKAFEACGSVQ